MLLHRIPEFADELVIGPFLSWSKAKMVSPPELFLQIVQLQTVKRGIFIFFTASLFFCFLTSSTVSFWRHNWSKHGAVEPLGSEGWSNSSTPVTKGRLNLTLGVDEETKVRKVSQTQGKELVHQLDIKAKIGSQLLKDSPRGRRRWRGDK